MARKFKKRLIILLIIIIAIIPLAFWVFYNPNTKLEVNFLNIGQGDAVLIKTPYAQNILIDGGEDITIIRELSKQLPWWDKQIDLIIISHPHNDHIGGLVDILKRYKVEQILYTAVMHDSPTYKALLELIEDKKIASSIAFKEQTIENLNEAIDKFESAGGA